MIRGLKLSVSTPTPLPTSVDRRRARDLIQSPIANDIIINYACVLKPSEKPEGKDSESFPVGEHMEI